MTDTNTLQQLAEQLGQLQQTLGGQSSGWSQPSAGIDGLQAVSIPIRVDGVRCALLFSPEYGNPDALRRLIERLENIGVPVDRYRKNNDWNDRDRGGYRDNYRNRGNWNNNGGGYRDSYRNRGWRD